jgi:hypothetical protein
MLPSPRGSKLILNRQTGQWGTEYHPERDLARLDLRSERLARPVEEFTISVVPAEGGGVLRLDWDTTRFSLPFSVAR